MPVLTWDTPGDHRYELGIDRGVLYLPEGGAVVWNGLTSVNEKLGREVTPYYLDGFPYLIQAVPGSYSATLQAYTYPDELDELTGVEEYLSGVFVHDQQSKYFHLSYRTLVGNDLEGMDHAYKVHILYNVVAVASDRSYATVNDKVSPAPFEWNLLGIPASVVGIRPTSHISLDSRRLASVTLQTLEETLYGTPSTEPTLPDMVELLTMVEGL